MECKLLFCIELIFQWLKPCFPGLQMGLQRTMQCSKEQYWDKLLQSCMSCGLACHSTKFKGCVDICRSIDCSKRMGFYYDKLLRDCIDCSGICGQHPKECESFCQRATAWNLPGMRDGLVEDPAATVPVPAALQGIPCKLDPVCDPRMFVYIGLGLCLCTLLFLLLTWVYLRKRGEEATCQASPVACHKKGDNPKDRLIEEGSMNSGSSGNQTPEPIETCGFCFPEVSPAVQETRACHKTYQPGPQGDVAVPRSAGTIPTPEDGHFQIICSPSQEKAQMT